MIIQNPLLTGSLNYNGADLSNVTSSNANSASVSLILTAVSSSNQQLSASYISLSGSYNTFSGSASTRVTKIENNYATTGSNSFRADQSITGSLVVSSTITAQTLVVQTVTSSILYSSGSNNFGNSLNNTQTFTGSVNITGSLTVNTTGTEFQVTNNGVVMGNVLTDNHSITGSLRVTGSSVTLAGSLTGTSALFTGTLTAASAATTGRIELGTNSLKGIMDYSAGTGLWYLHNQSAGAASVDYFQFQADGINVLNIKKSGASTFLNTLQINQSGSEIQQIINSNSNSNPSITQYKVNNSSGWEVGMSNFANSYSYLFSYGSFGTGNAKFTLTSAGAATFASSVTAAQINVSAPATTIYGTFDAVTSGYAYQAYRYNGTTYAYIGQQSSFIGGSSNTDLGIVSINNLIFGTDANFTERMRITSAGVVGIGTISPSGAYMLTLDGNTSTRLGGISFRQSGIDTFYLGNPTVTNNTDFELWNPRNGYTRFATNNLERMRITSGGKVVINDTFMDGLFGINTKSSVTYNANGYNGDNANIRLSNGSAGEGRYTGIAFGGGGSTEGFFGVVQNASNLADMVWQTYNGSAYGERMRMTSGGDVGIGNTAFSSTRLTVSGKDSTSSNYSIVANNGSNGNLFWIRNDGLVSYPKINDFTTGNSPNAWINPSSSYGIYINTSSIRYKKDVINYDKGIDIVNQLRPVYYKGISEVDGDKQFAGLIAEEIHDLGLTEFVNYNEEGAPNSLSYPNMIALAFKAIQELKATNDDLQTQINELKAI